MYQEVLSQKDIHLHCEKKIMLFAIVDLYAMLLKQDCGF